MQIGQSCTHPIRGIGSLDLMHDVDGCQDAPHLISSLVFSTKDSGH